VRVEGVPFYVFFVEFSSLDCVVDVDFTPDDVAQHCQEEDGDKVDVLFGNEDMFLASCRTGHSNKYQLYFASSQLLGYLLLFLFLSLGLLALPGQLPLLQNVLLAFLLFFVVFALGDVAFAGDMAVPVVKAV
jgi:hypothetical protein